jgi:hypothetical protein
MMVSSDGIHPNLKLSFLTEEETLQNCCTTYWSVDQDGKFLFSVKDVLKMVPELKLKVSNIGEFVYGWSVAESVKTQCRTCQKPYRYTNRTDFTAMNNHPRSSWVCSECESALRLEKQRLQKELEEQRRLKLFDIFFGDRNDGWNASGLTFRQAIYLVSAARLLGYDEASEDGGTIFVLHPLDIVPQSLTPNLEWSVRILKELYNQSIITVRPFSSPMSAFTFAQDSVDLESFDVTEVKWVPNLPLERASTEIQTIESWLHTSNWPDHWMNHEWQILAKEVAIAECIQYLLWVMKKHQFDFTPGDKTKGVIEEGLRYFAVSQLYRLMWQATTNAAAYYQREKVTRAQAANSVITRLQASIERARDSEWNVAPFQRSWDCARSMISEVVFSALLHSGDDGFTRPPHEWKRRSLPTGPEDSVG